MKERGAIPAFQMDAMFTEALEDLVQGVLPAIGHDQADLSSQEPTPSAEDPTF